MSWLDISEDIEFWWGKIPFGVISLKGGAMCCATTVGDQVVDLSTLDEAGCFDDIEGLDANVFWGQTTLDAYLTQPPTVRDQVRDRLQEQLQDGKFHNSVLQKSVLHPKTEATIHVPFQTFEEPQQSTPPPLPPKPDRYQGFRLYGFWKSSSTWRVRVALVAKKIAHEIIPIHMLKVEPDCKDKVNAMGQVPVLEFRDTHTNTIHKLSQSVAIVEFLEQAFPRRRFLFPKDPLAKAIAYQMIEIINSGIQPLQNLGFLQGIEQASQRRVKAIDIAQQAIAKGLAALEVLVVQHKQSTNRLGPFSMGTFSPSVVEAFLVPQMANAKRFGVDIEQVCPTLTRIDELCAQHQWFQQSHPDQQPDAGS